MNEFLTEASNLLKLHEGFASKVYKDTVGKLTLGYGRNLQNNQPSFDEWKILLPNGITVPQAEALLNNDINKVINWLSTMFKWWNNLTNNRKLCLIDIVYNIGKEGFLEFHNVIHALEKNDYLAAANALKASKWYNQVGQRGRNDVLLMLNG